MRAISRVKETRVVIDEGTGVVVSHESTYTDTENVKEGTYWKVYGDVAAAIPKISFSFVMALISQASYANKDQKLFFLKEQRKKMASEFGMTERMVDYNIEKLVDAGILYRANRGEYIVNPYYFGHGSWKDVLKLRNKFDELRYKKDNNKPTDTEQ